MRFQYTSRITFTRSITGARLQRVPRYNQDVYKIHRLAGSGTGVKETQWGRWCSGCHGPLQKHARKIRHALQTRARIRDDSIRFGEPSN